MRQPLVAGNWKMNGTRASIKELLDGIKAGIGQVNRAEMAVCAPFIYLADVESQLTGSAIAWGSEDVADQEGPGAFTGEISATMVKDLNCKYAIVGHSERRTLYGDSDEVVAKKFGLAQAAGLTPIFCIGETLEEREQGITEQVCARQIDAVIEQHGIDALVNSVIAYEPVWAIGTGKTATPEQAQEVHAFIRSKLAGLSADVASGLRILYGGSMNPKNAADLMAQADIDGGLIGGASLKPQDFLSIGIAANN